MPVKMSTMKCRPLSAAVGLSRHMHDAAHAPQQEIVVAGARGGVYAGLAEAGDRTIDHVRLDLLQPLVVETELLEAADPNFRSPHRRWRRRGTSARPSSVSKSASMQRLPRVAAVEISRAEFPPSGPSTKAGPTGARRHLRATAHLTTSAPRSASNCPPTVRPEYGRVRGRVCLRAVRSCSGRFPCCVTLPRCWHSSANAGTRGKDGRQIESGGSGRLEILLRQQRRQWS